MNNQISTHDKTGATVRIGDMVAYGKDRGRVIERNGELHAHNGKEAVPLSVLRARDGGFSKIDKDGKE